MYGKYKEKPCTIRLPEELWKELKKEAEKRNMSRNEYIKYILLNEVGGGIVK